MEQVWRGSPKGEDLDSTGSPGTCRFQRSNTAPPVQERTMSSVTESSSDEWEPMETAPLDGTPIQVCTGELRATVSWSYSINAWVIGLATEPNECDRILPWRPEA